MEPAGLSTAIMLALAAVLWFLYFVPSWVRRREYLATERTATRLQRTVRVMAETAELPDEVRLEASMRDAAKAERLRLAAERDATRIALRAAAGDRVEAEAAQHRVALDPVRVAVPASDLRQRLRRARRIAGFLLLAALAVAGYQFVLMATMGIAPGAWVVLAGCAVAAAVSIALQRRIRDRTRLAASWARAAARPAVVAAPLREAAPRRAWTPVQLPRPRYLEHPEAAPLGPSLGAPTMDAAARLRAAAAEAARSVPGVVPLPPREAARAVSTSDAAAPGVAGRYASMGVVGELSSTLDLDEVLSRRRRVG